MVMKGCSLRLPLGEIPEAVHRHNVRNVHGAHHAEPDHASVRQVPDAFRVLRILTVPGGGAGAARSASQAVRVVFPRTAANESYSYDCTQISGYKGASERTCVLNQDKASASWAIPTSFCVEDKLDLYFLIGIVLIIIGVVLLVLGILFMVKRDRKTLPKKPVSKTTIFLPFLQFHSLLLDCNYVINEWIVGMK